MKFLLALLIALCYFNLIVCEKVVNCYLGTWSIYRPGKGKFGPENIDPKLCTHLSYSFFGINGNGEFKMLDPYLDTDRGNIKQVVSLRKQNPKLKVLAVVGGWNEGSKKYSEMAADPSKRARFVETSLKFIEQHGFDGLDLDWEYPTQRGGKAVDRNNFVLLLKDLHVALKAKNLVLGIAVTANQATATKAYDIPNISKYVDFINVMTYDFNGSWSPILGMNAPLRGNGGANVESTIKYYLDKGAPAKKLLLGIGFYGRTFTTVGKTTPGSAARGAGKAGKYTREAGMLGYNEICENLKTWKKQRDTETTVPYAHNGNEWVSYDDVESIRLKMDFLKSLNLGGAMIWSIETDDFQGNCGESYPLLRAINSALSNDNRPDGGEGNDNKPDSNENDNNDEDSNEVDSNGEDNNDNDDNDEDNNSNGPSNNLEFNSPDCATDGFLRNLKNCARFYVCSHGIKYDLACPEGTYFDESLDICNFKSDVECNV